MQRLIVTNFDINDTNNKLRLDFFLSKKLHTSRNQIHNLIKAQKVWLNGVLNNKNGTLLKINDNIDVDIYEPDSVHTHTTTATYTESAQIKRDKNNKRFDIAIIYEDEDILIINKPPHLVIHEAPSVKEPTLVDWLKNNAHILHTLSGKERYGIIHRLDKQTSGALAIAKSHLAYQTLPQALKERQMGRFYLAIIDLPLKSHEEVRLFMGRNPRNRLKMSKIHVLPNGTIPKGARDSKSAFVKLATSDNGACELIAVKLYTGRTHQIRTHLESISRHILGDTLYGYKSSAKTYHYQDRILLHAYILYLNHPKSGYAHTFKAPILPDMLKFLQTHFTKDMPNDCQDIMQLLETDRIMRIFEHFA